MGNNQPILRKSFFFCFKCKQLFRGLFCYCSREQARHCVCVCFSAQRCRVQPIYHWWQRVNISKHVAAECRGPRWMQRAGTETCSFIRYGQVERSPTAPRIPVHRLLGPRLHPNSLNAWCSQFFPRSSSYSSLSPRLPAPQTSCPGAKAGGGGGGDQCEKCMVVKVGWGWTPHDGSERKKRWGGEDPGRGVPFFSADLSPQCNNGHDNDTGGGISTTPPHHHRSQHTHTHIPSQSLQRIKISRGKMNESLIAFICYNYHN